MYMRRFVKRMAAAVLLSACLVSLSGCSSNQDAETDSTISMDGTPVDDSMAQSIMLSAAQTLGVPKDQLIVQKLWQSQQAMRLQQLFMRLSWKFARTWAN